MKRTLSDLDPIPENTDGAVRMPMLKRAQTDLGVSHPRVAEVVTAKDGVLKLQNRALNIELAKRKREAEQLRQELDAAVTKERIKEAEFIGANAILSALDTTVKAILGASGVESARTATSVHSSVESFLSLGTHPFVDHADLRPVQFDVDEWSTEEAYCQAAIDKSAAEMSEEIRKLLTERVNFLQVALEKISRMPSAALSSASLEQSSSILLKKAEEEKLSLEIHLSKLKSALNDLGQRLFLSEKRRRKAEKALDCSRYPLDGEGTGSKDAVDRPPAVSNGTVSRDPTNQTAPVAIAANNMIVHMPGIEENVHMEKFRSDVAVLRDQVAEAEQRRADAERRLNDHLCAEPDSDARLTDRSEDILVSIKKKFSEHIVLLQTQVDKWRRLLQASEAAAAAVQQSCSSQIEQLSASSKDEINRLSILAEENQNKYVLAGAEIKGLQDVKLQAAELQFTVTSLRAECSTLRDQKKKLVGVIENLEKNLSQSRAREVALEASAGITGVSRREADLEIELEGAKAQMGDLFLEIEAVVDSEEKSREQCTRVLQQMADNQAAQQSVIGENIKLTQENKSLKTKLKDAEQRAASLQSLNTQLDGVLNQVKSNEGKLYADHCRDRHRISDYESQVKSLEIKLLEAESRNKSELSRYESLKKKWSAITERVAVLTTELENERKKRLKYEAVAKREKSSTSSDTPAMQRCSSTSSNLSQDGGRNQELLDLAMGMLKCSVCKERFKEVAITRCFHLFCKECIDETLRNRSRKCPACGEKFGQDDVRQVYFTH